MSTLTFGRILIANRGEIALRVMRACRSSGISSVAVYSDADANALHTRFADEAVRLGPAPSAESYLNIRCVLDAARRTRVDAIHPGYGFLSENADFAKSCAEAGVVFIGPSPETIRSMGDKTVARGLAAAAGLRIVPGRDDVDQHPDALREAVLAVGLPAIVKAAAGGGGRGMRIIRTIDELDSAIASAGREARQAFGDGRLFVECFIEGARHIEVQILGDQYGNLIHLYERDCSLQRRHQKVIEESPAPNLGPELRNQLCELAVKLGRSINYFSAGTVEFLVSAKGECFFIEVNTRLQVEHAVTEMVTGIDLVRSQIDIAEGKPLGFLQSDISSSGHSIEARLYAEKPANDFLPEVGRVVAWSTPVGIDGLRVESGIEPGCEVGIHYDPMLAKLIVRDDDRDGALRKLRFALRASSIQGVETNRRFLLRLLDNPEVVAGRVETGLIGEHLDDLTKEDTGDQEPLAAAVAGVYLSRTWRSEAVLPARLPGSYRNNPYRLPSVDLEVGGKAFSVSWMDSSDQVWRVFVDDREYSVLILEWQPNRLRLEVDGIQHAFEIRREESLIFMSSNLVDWVVRRIPRFPVSHRGSDLQTASAPMPGQVLKILIEKGQHVEVGAALVILEAMKMEQTIRASISGIVDAILVEPGQVVSPGDLLVRIVPIERDTP
ncbi:MAG: biotin carboxylase N-terminal domain-containing protein [Acidobacteriota bacterium]